MRIFVQNEKKNTMNDDNRFIRFDWAAKRILRDKANFGVLEGLITVLLNEQVHIVEILESESNQESAEDKFNRVDIKAKNSREEIILVEIQLTRELYYLERILYGVAKAITEHISLGNMYNHVKKVYSISILYFDLGQGADYLYHGTNRFVGVHTQDTLKVNSKEGAVLRMRTPEEIFPEYFIIRVNEFNHVATTPLEEWIDYLKTGRIKDDTTTPGLEEARNKLQYLSMSKEERLAYDRHISAIMVQNDVLSTAKLEGWEEGREEGRMVGRLEGREEGIKEGRLEGIKEGREEGKKEGIEQGKKEGMREIAKHMLAQGLSPEEVAKFTQLPLEEVDGLG